MLAIFLSKSIKTRNHKHRFGLCKGYELFICIKYYDYNHPLQQGPWIDAETWNKDSIIIKAEFVDDLTYNTLPHMELIGRHGTRLKKLKLRLGDSNLNGMNGLLL